MNMDLEQYRLARELSYERLARFLSLPNRVTVRRYAIGETWPDTKTLEGIFRDTGGEVTLDAMYRRRLAFVSGQGGQDVQAKPDKVAAA